MKTAAGFFGGALLWYFAHDMGTYFSGHECRYDWVPTTVNVVALLGTIFCGWISYRAWPRTAPETAPTKTFGAGIGIAAAVLFSIVLLWQIFGAIIYSECSR
jgi:hypothetical protein